MKRYTFTLTFEATDEFLNERALDEEDAPYDPDTSNVGSIPWAASRFLAILDSIRDDGDPTVLFENVTVEEV